MRYYHAFMRIKHHRFNTSARAIISEEDAKEILRPHFDRLLLCLKEAWASWDELGTKFPAGKKPLDSTTRANYMWNHIKANATKRFKGVLGVTVLDKGRIFALDIKGVALIRFKKLTKKYHSHNVPTMRQLQLAMQVQSTNELLPGIPDAATWLTCGYVLDDHQTQINEYVVTCVVDSDIKYVVPLEAGNVVTEEIATPQRAPRTAKVSPQLVPAKQAKQAQSVK
jgi:hypothetical protein